MPMLILIMEKDKLGHILSLKTWAKPLLKRMPFL
jgi:hypothetical protein